MIAIYLAPVYLLVCIYILLRTLNWIRVLHVVFQNVWVCRGIGLIYLFVVFSILIAFMAPARRAGIYDHDGGNCGWFEIIIEVSSEESEFSGQSIAFWKCGNCCSGSGLCGDHYDGQYLWNDQCRKYTDNEV